MIESIHLSMYFLRMMEKMDGQDVDLVIGGYTLHWERDNRFKDVNNKKDFCTADDCLDYCIRYGENSATPSIEVTVLGLMVMLALPLFLKYT